MAKKYNLFVWKTLHLEAKYPHPEWVKVGEIDSLEDAQKHMNSDYPNTSYSEA